MKLTYLVADTTLFGGVKIALHQANLMVRRGHQVKVVSPGQAPDCSPWRPSWSRSSGWSPR